MKFSRNTLAFMAVLAAGVLLATATFVLPSTATYGNETDQAIADALAREAAINAGLNKPSTAPAASAPTTQAPAPPAAPLDNNPAPAGNTEATGGNGSAPAGLPSTGNGGYLNTSSTTNYGFLLIGLGVAMMGSGSLVWAVSRRRR